MSPCEAISILLNADTDVTTIRDARYFVGLNLAPASEPFPYQYAIQRDKEVIGHLGGRSGFSRYVVEIESYADDADTCLNLASATRAALDHFKGTAEDGDDSFEFTSLKLDDESEVAVIPIHGREQGAAVIRQSYRILEANQNA